MEAKAQFASRDGARVDESKRAGGTEKIREEYLRVEDYFEPTIINPLRSE